MLNVIRMELYRMFHMRSFYVTLLCCIAMAGGMLLTLSPSINKYYDGRAAQAAAAVTTQGADGEDVIIASNNYEAAITAEDDRDIACPGIICDSFIASANLFIGFFMALFAGEFYHNGFCKNVISKTSSRYPFQLARLVCVMVYAAAALLLNTVTTVAGAAILIHRLTFTHMQDFALFLAGEYLLFCSIGLLSAFITDLFRSNIPAVIYSVLLTTTLTTRVVSLINSQVSDMFSIHFNMADYLPSLYQMDLRFPEQPEMMSKLLIHAILLSIGAFVVYNGLGMVQLRKRDF